MKYFKITLLAFAALLFISSCNSGVEENVFSINVKIDGLPEGNELVLQERTESGYEVTDTANIVENAFVFNGNLEQPKLVYITSAAYRGAIAIFVEAGDIQVTAHIDSIGKAVVTGWVALPTRPASSPIPC